MGREIEKKRNQVGAECNEVWSKEFYEFMDGKTSMNDMGENGAEGMDEEEEVWAPALPDNVVGV